MVSKFKYFLILLIFLTSCTPTLILEIRTGKETLKGYKQIAYSSYIRKPLQKTEQLYIIVESVKINNIDSTINARKELLIQPLVEKCKEDNLYLKIIEIENK